MADFINLLHDIGHGHTRLESADNAREKLDDAHNLIQEQEPVLQEEIQTFTDQADEAICESVENADPAALRAAIETIVNNLGRQFGPQRSGDTVPAIDTADLSRQKRDALTPMIKQYERIVSLGMNDTQIQDQIQQMFRNLNFSVMVITHNCWILKFSSDQLLRFMQKSREILNKAGKILFKELIERIRDKSKDSPDKYDCITKIIDGFKSCCYLELEVKVTDLLEPKQETSDVVVRILGSWEIKETSISDEVNLDQLIQRLTERKERFSPEMEAVLRGLRGTSTEHLQVPTESTSRTRPIPYESSELESTSSKRVKPELEKSASRIVEESGFLKQLAILRAKDKLTTVRKHCELLLLEYQKRRKNGGSSSLKLEYVSRIRDYIYNKLKGGVVGGNAHSKRCEDLANAVLFYLSNRQDPNPDLDTQIIIARLWEPLRKTPTVWLDLCCHLFDDNVIFNHISKQLGTANGGFKKFITKASNFLLLTPKSHLLVEKLRNTLTFEEVHRILLDVKDEQCRTCMFSTGSFEPYSKLYSGHAEKLYDLLMLTDNNRQTALHANTDCVAWIITSIYLPKYKNNLNALLEVTDSSNKAAIQYSQPYSSRKRGHYVLKNKPTVLIFASRKNNQTGWQLALSLFTTFNDVGSYIIQLEEDKNESEIVNLIQCATNKRYENESHHSALMVVLISPNIKESSTRASINLKAIETAMCENSDQNDNPKILISEHSDLTKVSYVPTQNHFCSILFPTTKGKSNWRQNFIHHLSELLKRCETEITLDSLFKLIRNQMTSEAKGTSALPVLMSTLIADFRPVYRSSLDLIESFAVAPSHPDLLSWLIDQKDNNRYLIPDNPTVLIFYMSEYSENAEEEALSIYEGFESTDLYNVRLYKDKNEQDILDCIQLAADKRDKYTDMPTSALIVFIMAQGTGGVLVGSDENPFKIEAVEEAMCGERIESKDTKQLGRPKILIIHTPPIKGTISTDSSIPGTSDGSTYSPKHDNFCTIMSRLQNHSYQNFFIPMLANQIKKCSGMDNLFRMIRQASREMEREHSTQKLIIMSTLRAQFCPGNRVPLYLRT